MKKTLLLFVGVLLLATLSAQNCSDLFISEYLEGSGNNKGVEIYNPTDGVINLGSYYIARYSNGSVSFTDGGITQLEGFLQPYKTHLLVNGQTESTETSPAADPNLQALSQQLDHNYPAPMYMNGNDAIALFKDLGGSGNVEDFQVLDLFGIIGGGMTGDDEGWASETDTWFYKNKYDDEGVITGKDSAYISNYIVPEGYYFYSHSLWTANHSLVRKSSVMHGVTLETMPALEFDVTMEWDTVPGGQDMWDSLNAHYCDCQYANATELNVIEESFSIYPNPAKEAIQVAFSEGINRISVYSLAGQELFTLRDLQGIRTKAVDVSNLPIGIYMISLVSDDRTLSKKLIKK